MNLTEKNAKLILIAIIAARGTSFCFSKMCLQTMSSFCLLGLRFTTAFIILFLIFRKKIISTLQLSDFLKGALFGSIYFTIMLCEFTGLRTTNSSTASFIENMAIVIVPFLNVPISRKLPTAKNLISVFMAVIGIGLLTLTEDGLSLSRGELFLLLGAFFYATAIITTNYLSKKGDALNMGIIQVGTIGVLGLVSSIIDGSLSLPESPNVYAYILALAIICTCFGYTLQPVAQSKLSAETTSLFCAVNPVVASLMGVVVLHEIPTPLNILGEVIIIIVLLFS